MKVLTPRAELTVDLRISAGELRHLKVAARVIPHPKLVGEQTKYFEQEDNLERAWEAGRAMYREFGEELMILRIPSFEQTDVAVENIFDKVHSHKALIVDLRGNPGGRVDSLLDFLAGVFDRDVKVGQGIKRDKTVPLTVKGSRHRAFTGDLLVLIDSESASAAEIFARVVQLEERGTILGDRSSGHVMEARIFPHLYNGFAYGIEVPVANTLMSDGKSLEGVGVEPDRTFLPTAADLAAGRDPVLSYAASLAGVTLTPEDAAKLFPKPKPEQ